jgi:hypothetical protein
MADEVSMPCFGSGDTFWITQPAEAFHSFEADGDSLVWFGIAEERLATIVAHEIYEAYRERDAQPC